MNQKRLNKKLPSSTTELHSAVSYVEMSHCTTQSVSQHPLGKAAESNACFRAVFSTPPLAANDAAQCKEQNRKVVQSDIQQYKHEILLKKSCHFAGLFKYLVQHFMKHR